MKDRMDTKPPMDTGTVQNSIYVGQDECEKEWKKDMMDEGQDGRRTGDRIDEGQDGRRTGWMKDRMDEDRRQDG